MASKIRRNRKEKIIMKIECGCGYIYDTAVGDPDNGIPAGTSWADVPDDFKCPICGLGKEVFGVGK